MSVELVQLLLGGVSGAIIGFSLALIGGGGSILAVPLMVYLVGVKEPHVAIGTSALAVGANAALGAFNHARAGNVRWSIGLLFAASGVLGAFGGSSLGKVYDGQRLLFLFAMVMIVVGVLMLRRRKGGGHTDAHLDGLNAPPLLGFGFLAGLVSGFFGIGGGFLIVPSLIAAADLAILSAIGTSLIAVTSFGLTTAFNYALSGLIDWALAGIFIGGGFVGSIGGARVARAIHGKGHLNTIFAGLVFVVAAYMLWRQWSAI